MREWIQKLVADKNGSPSEHVIFAICGILGLNAICAIMILYGHSITLADYGMAHGAIVTGGGAAQLMSKGS